MPITCRNTAAPGAKAMRYNRLKALGALYWYTVEFGLILEGGKDLRAYGAGILSGPTEARFAVEAQSPNRIMLNVDRVMPDRLRDQRPAADLFRDRKLLKTSYRQIRGARFRTGSIAALPAGFHLCQQRRSSMSIMCCTAARRNITCAAGAAARLAPV